MMVELIGVKLYQLIQNIYRVCPMLALDAHTHNLGVLRNRAHLALSS